MQLKTSFFSPTIYAKNISRFAPFWALYLLIWLMVLPVAIFMWEPEYLDLRDVEGYIFSGALTGGAIAAASYGLFCAMALFSPWYNSRSVNTLSALPIRRESMFLSNVATAFTVVIVPHLITAILTWIAAAYHGYSGFLLAAQWFAISTLLFVFFFGLASVCAMLVSNLAALPILYIIVNFAAVVLNWIVSNILGMITYGLSSSNRGFSESIWMKFSPFVDLLASRSSGDIADLAIDSAQYSAQLSAPDSAQSVYYFCQWSKVGILALVGVAFLVIALLLFRKRRMEYAGYVIAFKPLQPVFKYCFAIGCSLVLGLLLAYTVFSNLIESAPLLTIIGCMLIGAFIGYFVAEMLLKKSLHVFGRAWIGFGATCLVIALSITAIDFDVFGFERHIPKTEEIESVSIFPYYEDVNDFVEDKAIIEDVRTLHQQIVEEKSQNEAMMRQYDTREHQARLSDGSYEVDITHETVNIHYKLKDGSVIQRTYALFASQSSWLDESSVARQASSIISDPIVVSALELPSIAPTAYNISNATLSIFDVESDTYNRLELTPGKALVLYETCIVPDVMDGLLGDFHQLFFGNSTSKPYAATVDVVVQESRKEDDGGYLHLYDSMSFHVTQGSRTAAWIEENYHVEFVLEEDR